MTDKPEPWYESVSREATPEAQAMWIAHRLRFWRIGVQRADRQSNGRSTW